MLTAPFLYFDNCIHLCNPNLYKYTEHYPHPRCFLISFPNQFVPPSLTDKHWSVFCFYRSTSLFLQLFIDVMLQYILLCFCLFPLTEWSCDSYGSLYVWYLFPFIAEYYYIRQIFQRWFI